MSNKDKKIIGDFLLQLQLYQSYSISFNGDLVDRSVEELLDRIDLILDKSEISRLAQFIESGNIEQAIQLLVVDVDFNFETT